MSGAGGGSSKISLALNGRAKPTNGVKRSHAAALQDEDEEENQYGRSENVSHFDRKSGGAFDEKTKKDEGPLIIQRQANRDWKVEAERKRKRQKSGLPDGADGQGTEERMREVEERDAMKKPGLGLNLYKKESGDGESRAPMRWHVKVKLTLTASSAQRMTASSLEPHWNEIF